MDERVRETLSFLLPDFKPGDIPHLQTLLDGRQLLDAFITIFRGPIEEVIVRILVLATLARRGEAPRWTPHEIEQALKFIEPTVLDTARTRLSKFGLIVYDATDGTYSVGDLAFIVLAAWSSAMQFADERFGEFGFMNAQIVGGAQTLGVPEDLLRFALARTNTLHHELERAIVTGSADAIQEARVKINDAFMWGQQGVEILDKIAPDPNIGAERRNAARQLADAQSRMLGLAPRLDRTLHALESQRVRLGDSGIDSADLNTWLQLSSQDTLTSLIELAGIPMRAPGFLLDEVAIDVAQTTIQSERPEDFSLPPSAEAAEVPAPEVDVDRESLDRLFSNLDDVTGPVTLASLLSKKSFEEASYHFSLLPLLGGRGEVGDHDPASRLSTYALDLEIEPGVTLIADGDVAAVSNGHLRPRNER